mmetsp:Transcript_2477/g.9073  ORF Transcript_2477/g.9073 Transcript_2477/m.9073 type:complete len:302 (-) Transcript_2477:2876-3781(-)
MKRCTPSKFRRHAALTIGVCFFIITVSTWTLNHTRSREYWRKNENESARYEILLRGYTSSALRSVWPEAWCPQREKHYDVLLISHGGSGSSAGFNYFTKVLRVNSSHINDPGDKDGLKHLDFFSLSRRMVQCNITARLVVYQLGDPVDSVFSLYRRQFAIHHFKKLRPAFTDTACSRDIKTNVSLYAQAKQDIIGLYDHLDSYVVGSNSRPIVFMNSASRKIPGIASEVRNILLTFGVVLNGTDRIKEEKVDGRSPFESKYRNMDGYAELQSTYRRMTDTVGLLSPLSVCTGGRIFWPGGR